MEGCGVTFMGVGGMKGVLRREVDTAFTIPTGGARGKCGMDWWVSRKRETGPWTDGACWGLARGVWAAACAADTGTIGREMGAAGSEAEGLWLGLWVV